MHFYKYKFIIFIYFKPVEGGKLVILRNTKKKKILLRVIVVVLHKTQDLVYFCICVGFIMLRKPWFA